jgi:hypothetical protein
VEGPAVLHDRPWINGAGWVRKLTLPLGNFGKTVVGRARLQPGRYDPYGILALAPEGPAYETGKMSAAEIESQWTARRREQAGVFPTVRMRSAEKNPRPSEAWTGHPRE